MNYLRGCTKFIFFMAAVSSAPSLIKVLWDIENIKCDPSKLKRALRAYLKENGRCLDLDRMDFIAYHDPRMEGALPVNVVDTLVMTPVSLIDKGSKKGLSDHCLARDCRNIINDSNRYGLRVRCVVIVSSDSDYSAAGLYDDVNDSGVHLVVVHDNNFKRQLIDGSSAQRLFIHLEELLAWLPLPPIAIPPPSSSQLGLSTSPRPAHDLALIDERTRQLAITDSPSAHSIIGSRTAADAPSIFPTPAVQTAGVGARRVSVTTLETDELPWAEDNIEAFSHMVINAVQARGGTILGSQLGTLLRQYFNYSKLTPLLALCKGVEIVRPPEGGDFSVVFPGRADARHC